MKFTIEYLSKYLKKLPSDINLVSKDLIDLGLEVESISSDNDQAIELAIAPNRADLMSITGIARELAVKYHTTLQYPDSKEVNNTLPTEPTDLNHYRQIDIQVNAPEACPRYLARAVFTIDNNQDTPDWIKQQLIVAGISLISPVVDIANYVMLELGQPLHVFDLDQINNNIIIRTAKNNEQLILLDNNSVSLSKQDLVIADQDKILAIAGVMGGINSAVTANSKNILIECAYFNPINIRMTSKRHNILTDSSQRFAKHIDPNLQQLAMQRISALLEEVVGGQFAAIKIIESNQHIPTTATINLTKNHIERILGYYPSEQTITQILQGLGMLIKKQGLTWQVTIPSWRPDVKIPEDLIEELARFIGYNNIAKQDIALPLKFNFPDQKLNFTKEIQYKNYLANCGYREIISYSFIDFDTAKYFCVENELYQLQNPISKSMNVMRPHLWPGLINALVYNQHRKQNKIKIFELGTVFRLNSKLKAVSQSKKIAGLINGRLLPENWQHANQEVDFFALKNHVLALINLYAKQNPIFKPVNNQDHNNQYLHPQQSAEIYIQNIKVGEIGKLHPKLSEKFTIHGATYVFELDLAGIYTPTIIKFEPISKFPAIRRDFSIVVDQSIDCEQIKQAVIISCGGLLQEIVFFDVFTDQNLLDNKKSIAFGVILQHREKTLIEQEINQFVDEIKLNLSNIGAQLRV